MLFGNRHDHIIIAGIAISMTGSIHHGKFISIVLGIIVFVVVALVVVGRDSRRVVAEE